MSIIPKRIETSEYAGQEQWEYRCRNLRKVAGVALEQDLNREGDQGFEAVCVADGYLVMKRRVVA